MRVGTPPRRSIAPFAVSQEELGPFIDAVPPMAGESPTTVPVLFGTVCAWTAVTGAVRAAFGGGELPPVLMTRFQANFERPLTMGTSGEATAEVASVRPSMRGTAVRLHAALNDEGQMPFAAFVIDAYAPSRSAAKISPEGEACARELMTAGPVLTGEKVTRERIGCVDTIIEGDWPRRYATAAGDHNPIHVDREAAARLGFPDVVMPGFASLGLAIRAVVASSDQGHETPVASALGCWFSAPAFPGDTLRTVVYKQTPRDVSQHRGAYGFETVTERGPVLRCGYLETR